MRVKADSPKQATVGIGYIKVPLLWVMKGSYFGFGSPQLQVDMHTRSKNTFIFL